MKAPDWNKQLQPLLKKYKGKKHPLDYQNTYQLVVMVVLSAQDSDRNINKIAPAFFEAFPNMAALAKATKEDLLTYISKVRSGLKKSEWLLEIAKTIKKDSAIPLTQEELTQLPGIGRKSANVIMREAGATAEGVIVDLHVVRVAPRIGIASGTDPKKIETAIMNSISEKNWGEIGMAISFLGREICRPKEPKCEECPVSASCAFYASA